MVSVSARKVFKKISCLCTFKAIKKLSNQNMFQWRIFRYMIARHWSTLRVDFTLTQKCTKLKLNRGEKEQKNSFFFLSALKSLLFWQGWIPQVILDLAMPFAQTSFVDCIREDIPQQIKIFFFLDFYKQFISWTFKIEGCCFWNFLEIKDFSYRLFSKV